MDYKKNFLCIPDLQIPFEHKNALQFVKKVKKFYSIPDENMICLGDETDQYYGSLYKLDPNAHMTANAEIENSISTLKEWYAEFPIMKVAISNHGTRWQRKALECNIPQILMRRYEEWIQAPQGWQWQKSWIIRTKNPFLVEHGDDWGGTAPHVSATMHNGISTIMGHHHSKCEITHIVTAQQTLWACVSGALINFDEFAFHYARKHAKKPVNCVTVVTMEGRMPVIIPL